MVTEIIPSAHAQAVLQCHTQTLSSMVCPYTMPCLHGARISLWKFFLARREARSRQEVRALVENERLGEEAEHLRHLLAAALAGPSEGSMGIWRSGISAAGGDCQEARQLALWEGTRGTHAQLEQLVLRLEAALKGEHA